jgi:hypothetical protein
VSGNKNGRPRKSEKPRGKRPLAQAARDIFLDEAYREVTLSEGGEPVKLTMAQAIVRALGVTALKGSAHAQKNYLALLLGIERKVSDDHAAVFGRAMIQKLELEQKRAQWVSAGGDEMAMPLHPDDIQVDPLTGDVALYSALPEEQVAARDALLCLRDEQQWIITRSLAMAQQGIDGPGLKARRETAESVYEEANSALPPRFRTGRLATRYPMHDQSDEVGR